MGVRIRIAKARSIAVCRPEFPSLAKDRAKRRTATDWLAAKARRSYVFAFDVRKRRSALK